MKSEPNIDEKWEEIRTVTNELMEGYGQLGLRGEFRIKNNPLNSIMGSFYRYFTNNRIHRRTRTLLATYSYYLFSAKGKSTENKLKEMVVSLQELINNTESGRSLFMISTLVGAFGAIIAGAFLILAENFEVFRGFFISWIPQLFSDSILLSANIYLIYVLIIVLELPLGMLFFAYQDYRKLLKKYLILSKEKELRKLIESLPNQFRS